MFCGVFMRPFYVLCVADFKHATPYLLALKAFHALHVVFEGGEICGAQQHIATIAGLLLLLEGKERIIISINMEAKK